MVEGEPREIRRDKLIVEIGSQGWPAFTKGFFGHRKRNLNEYYVTVNKPLPEGNTWDTDPAAYEQEKYGRHDGGFSAITGDASELLLPDETVDELIYHNVFGDKNNTKDRHLLLQEAARVLKADGKIVIYEDITPADNQIGVTYIGSPRSLPDECFETDELYFARFGLYVESCAEGERRNNPDFPSFKLILKKIPND